MVEIKNQSEGHKILKIYIIIEIKNKLILTARRPKC